MNNKKSDIIRVYNTRIEPKIDVDIENLIYKAHSKIAFKCVEEMDNLLVDAILQSLPEDVSQLYILDRKAILKIVLRDIPKKPRIKIYPNNVIAFHCGHCDEDIIRIIEGQYWDDKPVFCRYCGTRMDWSTENE